MGGTCCSERCTADSGIGWPLTVAATALAEAAEAVCAGAGGAALWGACAKTGTQGQINPRNAQKGRCMIRMRLAPQTRRECVGPRRPATWGASAAETKADCNEEGPLRRDEKMRARHIVSRETICRARPLLRAGGLFLPP